MLFLLLLHITKQYFKQRGILLDFKKLLNGLVKGIKYGIPFFLISFSNNNEPILSEHIKFDIIKNEKIVGFVQLQKVKKDNKTNFRIHSEVNTKLLLNFKVTSKETYNYNNDTLIYSSIYRTLNNKIKVNQAITYKKGNYYLKNSKTTHLINADVIKCNLVKLFFDEPTHVKKVYCDKLNTYVEVIKVAPSAYKVIFPNKSYTIFHYKNNRCKLIEAVGSFYRVKLIPNNDT